MQLLPVAANTPAPWLCMCARHVLIKCVRNPRNACSGANCIVANRPRGNRVWDEAPAASDPPLAEIPNPLAQKMVGASGPSVMAAAGPFPVASDPFPAVDDPLPVPGPLKPAEQNAPAPRPPHLC